MNSEALEFSRQLAIREAARVDAVVAADKAYRTAVQRRQRKMALGLPVEAVDATSERLARDEWEYANPAEIDSTEQPIGRVRRRVARETLVDRLYRSDKIDWRLWYAMETWLRWQEAATGSPRLSGLYDQPGVGSSDGHSLLPLSDRAEKARFFMKSAKEAIAPGFFADILALAANAMRLPSGRASGSVRERVIDALHALANWMCIPGEKALLDGAEKVE